MRVVTKLPAMMLAILVAAPAQSAEVLQRWDFADGLQGWQGIHLVDLSVTAEGARLEAAGGDPQLVGPAVPRFSGTTTDVVIRMKSDADNDAADLFYGPSFTAEDSTRFTVATDGKFHDYVLAIPPLPDSSRLRLDPTDGSGIVVVDSIVVRGTPDELRLDNGRIAVGMNVRGAGGALTYLGASGRARNLINNHDLGRQIQQSYYAGQSLDRRDEGQNSHWAPWPWNPVQAGDSFGHRSRVFEASSTGDEIYTRTRPQLWDMNNEPAECVMETWVRLEGNVARVRNRLTVDRGDDRWTQVVPRHQELPAVYTITELPRLVTYLGDDPWTRGPLTTIERIVIPGNEGFPWNHWPSDQYPGLTTEGWAATVDERGWGVGVFYPQAELFVGGRVGAEGQDEMSGATMYMSPLRTLSLDRDDVFEFSYDLIVGTLEEMREYIYHRMTGCAWLFDTDGDWLGWQSKQHTSNEKVSNGSLAFEVTGVDPILEADELAIAAPLNPYIHVRMRNRTNSSQAQFFWTNEFGGPGGGRVVSFTTSRQDLAFQDYVIDMASRSSWRGKIRALRFDPAAGVRSGSVEIRGIAVSDSPVSPFGPEVGGLRLPGDCNGDQQLDLSDAVCLFGFLFQGHPTELPCGEAGEPEPDGPEADVALLDWNGDDEIDLSDGIGALLWLFQSGPPHPLGASCTRIQHCPDACAR